MAAFIRSVSLAVTRCRISHGTVRPARSFGTFVQVANNLLGIRGGLEEDTEEYTFVDRLIPPTRIPSPPKYDGCTPSGWTPPPVMAPRHPYMIRRSRMHNVPVYSDIKHGNQKTTLLRKVEGDIWALNNDIKTYLQNQTGREPPTQVNEVTGTIRIKGQFDRELKEWLVKQGF